MSLTSIEFESEFESHRIQQLIAAWGKTYGQERSVTPLTETVAPVASNGRGAGDARAAWQRWHEPSVEAQFTSTEWPWYALLERARVEVLASRHLPGMARNLNQPEILAPADPDMARLYQTARHIFGGHLETQTPILGSPQVNSPKKRTGVLRPWWRLPWQLIPADQTDALTKLKDADIIAALQAAKTRLDQGPSFATTLHPLVTALAEFYSSKMASQPVSDAPFPSNTEPDGDLPTEEEDPDAIIERPGGSKLSGPNLNSSDIQPFPNYPILSRAWDEEYCAIHWSNADDTQALNTLNSLDRRRVRQLAHRLQRRLLAARLRHWCFDQEDGRLDNRRLTRLIGNDTNPRIFRVENEAPVPEACVTLLVDQSGSMRGIRQHMAALAIDLAVHTLELCQIRCEVLGYTTRFRADNPICRHWQQMGCPEFPGRLNALRHILYKTANQPWRRARPQLGLLLREGFGKENIDGEALHWAACRLMRQAQPRKVLVVLSDGSPYDEATANANGREFLENHLRAVIAEIEASPIRLVAIGTGQDVGRYYRHAVTVRCPEAVAEILFDRLGDLLTQPNSNEHIL